MYSEWFKCKQWLLCVGVTGGAVLSLALTACADVDRDAPFEQDSGAAFGERGEDVAEAAQALNGTVTFPDETCGGAGSTVRAKISNAFSTARSWGASAYMTDCLTYHGMSMTNGDSPEVIQQKVLENMPTRVVCGQVDGGYAEAGVNANPEEIKYDIDYVSDPNTQNWHLAAIALHEVAHNKGYEHVDGAPTDLGVEESYTAAVGRMGFCAEAIGRNEFVRTSAVPTAPRDLPSPRNRTEYSAFELSRGSLLNLAGHQGGGPHLARCPNGQFASGLRGRSGGWISAIGMTCRNADGMTDGEGSSVFGGSDGATFEDICPSGGLLVGVEGSGGGFVGSLRGICQPATTITARANVNVTYTTTRGSAVTPKFQRRCPLGQVVKQLRTRTGALVDGFELECQTIMEPVVQGTYSHAVKGSTTDKAYYEFCPYGSVLTSLTGASGAELDRLAGVCTQVVDNGDTVALIGDEGIPIEGHGGSGGGGFFTKCPAGMALAGAVLHYGQRIDGIQGICANVVQWSTSSGTVATSLLDYRGGNGGGTETLSCPREYFLGGWEIWEGVNGSTKSVFGIKLKCIRSEE